MKKIMEVSIGGYSFALEEDAYFRLKDYLARFEATIADRQEAKEVMEDVEARVAEIFEKERKYPSHVITVEMVNAVIGQLGEIESDGREIPNNDSQQTEKRFFRDPDNKMIAGVCSGLAAYFSIDVVVVRILFLIGLIFYTTTFWAYVIIWIATKPAVTILQKLRMRGIPPTAENIRKYSTANR
ncbi:MAG: PspC domain-containing protein [Prevotella sp.]|jgi:phage shock protein PspC (stress-responsive transcriptional regulator)|nr:PspC domain-containing protein [Prevotella sp.]